MPRRLPIIEFIALMAFLMSMVAFSIDAMLPGLPDIAADLSADAPNRAQLVVTAFMLGMGVATLFSGPLADAYGRKAVVTGGTAIFVIGSFLAYVAQSLEMLLAARVIQGLGVAGPRIAPLAMVRDLYEGRRMAQISSFVFMVFMLVPAAAPFVGKLFIDQWGWRSLFLAFVGFACIGMAWLNTRLTETLNVADRRPIKISLLKEGFVEIITNRMVMVYTLATSLGFGMLVALLSSTQQVYAETFQQVESFPAWFALTALIGLLGTLLNGVFVVRLGMRRLVIWAFGAQALVSVAVAMVFISGVVDWAGSFPLWLFWTAFLMFNIGFILGNLNALTLQPLGHIAGLGASVTIAISTIAGVLIGGPIGLSFNGTPVPLVAGVGILAALSWLLVWRATREML